MVEQEAKGIGTKDDDGLVGDSFRREDVEIILRILFSFLTVLVSAD